MLVLFVALTGAGLEQAFVQSALQSQRDRSQGLIYALLGAAEPKAGGTLSITNAALPDPRLEHVQSGLEAVIFNSAGDAVWHSPNLSGPLPPVEAPPVGGSLLRQTAEHFVFSYGVRWYGKGHHPHRYTIAVIAGLSNYEAQLAAFRHTLWIALGVSAATLVLLQFFLLRWSLSPLRQLTAEVREIETGAHSEIRRSYPQELMPLAHNLNAMIRTERSQLTRYRNALGDLAHSLKTPLAVLRGLAEAPGMPAKLGVQIDEPLARMEHIADYQLRRAAAAGRRVLSERVALRTLTDKVMAALAKVYADKQLDLRNEVDDELRVRADEGDLYDIIGNLADNACKWARQTVVIRSSKETATVICVEDDGPGFPSDAKRLLNRGVRADTRVAGQGIGLATVADIVSLGGGQIELSRSETLGGGCVTVHWPE